MASVQHGRVHNLEQPGDAVGAPSTTAASVHPTSRPPDTGASNPPQLERRSVAEAAGPEALSKASTVAVAPSAPGEPPHIHAPAAGATGEHGGGVKEKLKEVWHDVKEITPGTKEHRQEYGTSMAMGGYRSQLGKR